MLPRKMEGKPHPHVSDKEAELLANLSQPHGAGHRPRGGLLSHIQSSWLSRGAGDRLPHHWPAH